MYQQNGMAFPSPAAVGSAILWQQQTVRRLEEVPAVLAEIVEALRAVGYPSRDCFAVRLAVEEALVNALRHGHQGDTSKEACVRYGLSSTKVLVEVEDQGPGFDPGTVADPLAADNLSRPSGRGLLLMAAYTTWMRHNKQGNRVTLCRKRSAAPADAGVLLIA